MFDGWTPREVHEHYDADGALTGTTVVRRESEWDDETRDRALSLAAYQDSVCGCGCGLSVEDAHKDQPFVVDKFKCYARRAIDLKREADVKRAKKEKWPDSWESGLHYFARPHKPKGGSHG